MTIFVLVIEYNLEKLRREKRANCIYPHFCLPYAFFFPNIQRFTFYCFLSVWKPSFCILLGWVFWQQILCFSSFWECLDFPFILEEYFPWTSGSEWTVLPFQHLKTVVSLPSGPVASDKKVTVIWIVFPLQRRCHFSLTAFKIFCYCSVFSSFFSFYSHQYPTIPTQLINKMIQCNVISITNQMTVHVKEYLWTIFCFIPLFVYTTLLITLLLKSSLNFRTLLFFVKIVSLLILCIFTKILELACHTVALLWNECLCPPPKFICWSLIPSVMVFGSRIFRSDQVMKN